MRQNDDPVYIGTSSVKPAGLEWNGWIDDVRIYDYALSAEEIKTLYEATKNPSEKP